MLTITISARAIVLAALLALASVSSLYATDALGSGDPPDSILQGDTDCDGDVDATDALNDLRYAGGLGVGPFGACPEIGTEAAIPGPQGPQGEQGPQGPEGPPGISEFAHVRANGDLEFGTAMSAEQNPGGAYLVTFDHELSGCAAVASQGTADGGVFNSNARLRAVTVFSDTVSVSFAHVDTGAIVSTDFHLIVAC